MKAQPVHVVRVTEDMRLVLTIIEERISSWHRMIRVVAWVWRFIKLLRKTDEKMKDELSASGLDEVTGGMVRSLVINEIQYAETTIVKWMQERDFENDIKIIRSKKSCGLDKKEGQLWRLSPFLDEEGLLRVGGRLIHAEESKDFRFPVIIPKHTTSTKP